MPRHPPASDSPLSESLRTKIKTVLENVHRQLQEAGATARRHAPSIHESFYFEPEQRHLGYLCELVAELMNAIAAKLVVASVLQTRSLALAVAIEEQRRRLRQAQAVLCSMTYFLRTAPQPQAPHLTFVFSSLNAICESALTALNPVALGLPIPAPDI